MSGVLDVLRLAGPVHEVAVTCTTGANGQQFCTQVSAGAFAGLGILIVIYLAILVVTVVAYVKIITKAGYSGWWVLIGLVPIANVVLFLIFAFAEWPVLRELRMMRQYSGGGPGFGRPVAYGPGPGAVPPPSAAGPAPAGPWGHRPPGSPTTTPPAGKEPAAGATEDTMEQAPIPSFGEVMRGAAGFGAATAAPATTQPSPAAAGSDPPAGWFPAPGGPEGRLRYWDGAAWTEHYH